MQLAFPSTGGRFPEAKGYIVEKPEDCKNDLVLQYEEMARLCPEAFGDEATVDPTPVDQVPIQWFPQRLDKIEHFQKLIGMQVKDEKGRVGRIYYPGHQLTDNSIDVLMRNQRIHPGNVFAIVRDGESLSTISNCYKRGIYFFAEPDTWWCMGMLKNGNFVTIPDDVLEAISPKKLHASTIPIQNVRYYPGQDKSMRPIPYMPYPCYKKRMEQLAKKKGTTLTTLIEQAKAEQPLVVPEALKHNPNPTSTKMSVTENMDSDNFADLFSQFTADQAKETKTVPIGSGKTEQVNAGDKSKSKAAAAPAAKEEKAAAAPAKKEEQPKKKEEQPKKKEEKKKKESSSESESSSPDEKDSKKNKKKKDEDEKKKKKKKDEEEEEDKKKKKGKEDKKKKDSKKKEDEKKKKKSKKNKKKGN
jgi:hypothetical protein